MEKKKMKMTISWMRLSSPSYPSRKSHYRTRPLFKCPTLTRSNPTLTLTIGSMKSTSTNLKSSSSRKIEKEFA